MGRAIVEFIIFMVFLLAGAARGYRGAPCGSYGCPHRPRYEPFVPAPPGHTPRCAKPGQTFCESPDHYPQQLIKFLVDKCSYDFATVLRDESHYHFNSHRSEPEYHRGYDYPRQEVTQFYPQATPSLSTPDPQYSLSGQTGIVYGQPSNDTNQEGYSYTPPARSHRNPFLPDAPSSPSSSASATASATASASASASASVSLSTSLQNSQGNFGTESDPAVYRNRQLDPSIQGQIWWSNRYSRRSGAAIAPPRSRRENPLLEFASENRIRNKRQGRPDAISLCPTSSDYITPRAALNNQGNWMYVVNLPETREKYSQLVRSETCATNQCSGLCSLPDGYSSRCEQQYVQKRLIALEGSGNRLYTDVFWFPHGCVCKISLDS